LKKYLHVEQINFLENPNLKFEDYKKNPFIPTDLFGMFQNKDMDYTISDT